MDSVWQEDHFVIFNALHAELPWTWAREGILHLTLQVQSQENNLRTRACAQSDSPSLRVLSWAHSSAFYLSPSSPVLPLFPGCTPTCPGLPSREFSLAGGMLSEPSFSSPSLFFFVFPGLFPSIPVLANYRHILLPAVYCRCCWASTHLPPPPPCTLPHQW